MTHTKSRTEHVFACFLTVLTAVRSVTFAVSKVSLPRTQRDGRFRRAPHCPQLDSGPRIDLLVVCVCGLKPLFVTLPLAPVAAGF